MRTSNIFVTVDILILKKSDRGLNLLLIKRKNDPYKGKWAIPGGFVDQDEDLEDAAKRELKEETNVAVADVVQLKAFGKPGRDPRHHTVSVAFYAFVDQSTEATAADDADQADWFDLNELPELAFDHSEIISFAKESLKL
ncbi:MAG: NUDIX hydrolase [Flavobacterium sp.]|nr:NUDIX hydrolase [Flavobacterium sp.]